MKWPPTPGRGLPGSGLPRESEQTGRTSHNLFCPRRSGDDDSVSAESPRSSHGMTAAPGQVGATTGSGGEQMGRESRFLLALLGLLAGVFVAALSLKLFVPRPPQGTGPDIHAPSPASIAELVPPPDLTPSPVAAAPWDRPPDDATPAPSRFSAPVTPTVPPPDTASADSPLTAIEPADVPTFTAISPPPAPPLPVTAPPPSLSPSGDATTGENVVVPVAAVTAAAIATPAVTTAAPQNQQPAALSPSSPPLSNAPAFSPPPAFPPPPTPATVMPGQPYTVAAGDSWWGIAEQAYGDGRLYRSLFAWNRALDPRVSLAEGTTLEIPARDRLHLAWPQLTPAN